MSKLKGLLAGVLILAVSVGIAFSLVKGRKRPQRTPPAEMVQLVEYLEVSPQTHYAKASGFGTTIAAQETQLRAQVSGRVTRLSASYRPGGRFTRGQSLVNLDPRDYQIAAQQQRASVGKAELDLQLEKGRKRVAEREFKLLSSGQASQARRALILREPQLATAQLALEAAQSGLERAELNLERTQVRAPFNGFLKTKNTDVGEMIGPSSPLGTFVGTDAFWVRVTLPLESARLLGLFQNAADLKATVVARQGDDAIERTAKVLEWTGELDALSKTVQVLVEIDDPLSLKAENTERPPLLLGSLVQVHFQGPSQSNILEIPRAGIREGSQVFAIDSEDRLIIRDASLAWKSRDAFYVRDNANELRRIIIGKVQLAVEGAKLNPIKEGQEPPSATPKGKKSKKVERPKAPHNADGTPDATGPRAKAPIDQESPAKSAQ